MQVVVSASVTFDAGHRAAPPPQCEASDHGHRWEVRASCEGDEYLAEMIDSLEAVAFELRHRDLNEMLPGVKATPGGVAAYFRERINLHVPTLVGIAVDNGMSAASITWERR